MVTTDAGLGVAPLVWLGNGATTASPESVKTEVAKLAYLRNLGADHLDLSVIRPERLRQLAALARRPAPSALGLSASRPSASPAACPCRRTAAWWLPLWGDHAHLDGLSHTGHCGRRTAAAQTLGERIMSTLTRAAAYTVRIAAVTAATPVLAGAAAASVTAKLAGWELRQLASSPLSAGARRVRAESASWPPPTARRRHARSRPGTAARGTVPIARSSRSGKARAQLAAVNSSR